MEELEVEVRDLERGVTLLELRGSLDLNTATKLSRVLGDLVERGRQREIIDLSGVSHVSSVGWGTLLKAGRQLKASGGELKLAAMNDRVRKIFELLELGHEMSHLESVEAAFAAFPK